ncbi:MAG TPA: PAS domain S-box protein, partial [Planctomycetaceae bacterium]
MTIAMTSNVGPTTPEIAPRVAPPPVSRWAAIGLGVALAFFTATAALSYRNQVRLAETEELASASRLLIGEVGELVSLLQSAETAQRAYLLADGEEGQEEFLRTYEVAVAEVPAKLRDVRDAANSAEQATAIAELTDLARNRLGHLTATLTIYKADGPEAARREVASGKGSRLMWALREKAEAFQDQEQEVLRRRRDDANRASRVTHASDLLAAAVGLGLAALAFVRLRREFLGRYAVTQALDEQRELLHVTVHSIGDAVVTTDPDGRVRSLNAVAERLLSWPSAEAVGRPLGEVFRVVHEPTRAAAENPAVKAVREGQTVRQPAGSLLIARDNTERRIDGSAAPIRTADGRVLGAVLTFRDVTDRKRAEDALRRSEERLRRSLRASRTVAWEIDVRADVVIRSENVTDLLGLPPFGSVSEYLELIHPEDRPAVDAALARSMRGEADYSVECRVTLPEGRTLWVADKGEVRRDDRGEPSHVVGVLMDVTELKRAEEELREADRRKDRFLATLAHELRNPLAPISNALQAWPFVKGDPAELERLRET